MTLYNGREYKWWIRRNAHFCYFCMTKHGGKELEVMHHDTNHPGRLGLQCLQRRKGEGQYSKGYWNTMAAIFVNHIKRYHPEVKVTKSQRGY